MLDAIEKFREVDINAMSVTLPDDPLHLLGSFVGGPVGAKAEARVRVLPGSL